MESTMSVCETINCNGIPVKYRYEAVVHCPQCSLNMCADCHRAHKRSSKTRSHVTGDVVDRYEMPFISENEPTSTSSLAFENVKKDPAMAAVKLEERVKPEEPVVAEPTAERPFPCTQCVYSAKSKKLLRSHLKSHMPPEEREFACDQCSYRSITLGTLNIHKRVHTGDKPYKCPICSMTTAHQTSFRKHMTKVHGGNEMLECPTCSYRTRLRDKFDAHKARHTESAARLAARSAARSAALKGRAQLESIETPYHCSICAHKSPSKSTFVNHVIQHVDTTLKCCFCAFVARGSRFVKLHMELHHTREHTVKHQILNAGGEQSSHLVKNECFVDNADIIRETAGKIEQDFK